MEKKKTYYKISCTYRLHENRKKSIVYSLWVYLCSIFHNCIYICAFFKKLFYSEMKTFLYLFFSQSIISYTNASLSLKLLKKITIKNLNLILSSHYDFEIFSKKYLRFCYGSYLPLLKSFAIIYFSKKYFFPRIFQNLFIDASPMPLRHKGVASKLVKGGQRRTFLYFATTPRLSRRGLLGLRDKYCIVTWFVTVLNEREKLPPPPKKKKNKKKRKK